MRLLDLYCGAGGAAMGYHQAGFEVVGVDLERQPSFPFEFHQADALDFPLEGFDAIHASPPCKAHTIASNGWKGRLDDASERWPDLIGPTRERLIASGLPYVIENVPGAPLINPITLCGLSFGLNVKRHREFESNILFMDVPPCPRHDKDYVIVFNGGVQGRAHQIGRTAKNGPIIRRSTLPLKVGQDAMGIPWMNRMELSQAIPPAYTRWIGERLMEFL